MTENAKYWGKRFDHIEQRANDKSVEYVASLDEKYRRARKAIQDKIDAWYQRFADNNQITMSEARKWLDDSELEELKWTVEEYIKYGRENAVDGKWIKQLENASAKAHISRLEALKVEIYQQVEVASGGMTDDIDKLIKSAYTDTYYRSCYEIERGTKIGFDVTRLDPSKVDKLISKPWAVDGSDFSSRIWTNKAKLLGTLDKEISRMVLTGESPVKTIKRISEAMNTSKANAARVVFTEQAYYTTLAQHDAYDNLEVDEYEIVCTLDNKTCDVCGSYDGKHYPTKDMEVGINAPPWHPNCRCTTCPYFDDIEGERAARDKDGKAITVPSNMTYEEWKEKYVKTDKPKQFEEERKKAKAEGIPYDATKEWLYNAKPNTGKIMIDAGYDETKHKDEIEIAKWVHSMLGGDIKLLKEATEDHVLMPDYLWNNKLWDLKNISSAKAANSAIRHGIKQINDNIGGIILNMRGDEYSIDELEGVIAKRMQWYKNKNISIVLKKNDKLIKVLEY